ncbi:MAG: IS200/IS605 family transposase [Candidatus Electryonea clarkiae]|nr:IS200/IS605 family transposase [Candidatus Electryonea clarkiae]MDP8287499.1 IS200/IS605 family transposase [Candidatus Electryonea clarkiae]
MSTYTQIIYHIVFSTKDRKNVITTENRDELFRYIWGIIKNKKCHLYRMNGTKNHLHILSHLHPSICLADYIREIKVGSTKWIKENKKFQGFTNWQDGYSAFTHSIQDKNTLIEYIKNQNEHHNNISFIDEYRTLLNDAGIEFDEKYLF